MAQYLDYSGLVTLWGKIKSADAVNAGLIQDLQNQINALPTDYSRVNDMDIVDGQLVLMADGEQVGAGVSVKEFVADGMVDDITIVEATEENPINGETSGKFIQFTWNTAAGSKVEYLPTSELGHVDLTQIEADIKALQDDLSDLSSNVNSKLSSLEAELDQAQVDIEALKAATDIGEVVYEVITKDESGNYVGSSENAPKTHSVVDALNELKSELSGLDLSAYYTKEEVNDLLDDKQDLMEAIPEQEILDLI